MKIGFALAGLALMLAGCTANINTSTIAALPGAPSLAPLSVVNPFKLSKGNVIHRYTLSNSHSNPYLMATGSDKSVWYTEFLGGGYGRIGKITQTGQITEYPVADDPRDIAAGAAGTLWFTLYFTIGKITTDGTYTEYKMPRYSCPYEIAKGPDGNMWFTDTCVNGIGIITTTGSVTYYTIPPDPPYNSTPIDIVTGPDGNLWFTEADNYGRGSIGKLTPSGTITKYIPTSGSIPFAIAAGPDGNLYASTYNGIWRITTAGVITEYTAPSPSGDFEDIILGPDRQMWLSGSSRGYLLEFNPKTQTFSAPIQPDSGNSIGGLTVGADGDIWMAGFGQTNKPATIDVYEEQLPTIGIRLNGELSITDTTYGFELGFAKGTGTTTQTISLSMGESVTFKNLDTIPHSAAFLGNATPSPSTWPAAFTGSTTQSPAFTAIGTTGFATGSLNPNKSSPVYETGSPGFYMIGCQYHYVSDKMRTVVIVH